MLHEGSISEIVKYTSSPSSDEDEHANDAGGSYTIPPPDASLMQDGLSSSSRFTFLRSSEYEAFELRVFRTNLYSKSVLRKPKI